MRLSWIFVATTLSAACGGEKDKDEPVKPPVPSKPIRGAVGDRDLRVMIAELASAKACDRIRGTFRGLRAQDDDKKTTGVLWTRECKVTSEGTTVTFALGGQGWQWAERKEKKAGAEFELREYIKFDVDAKITGTIDVAYDTKKKVASIWFSPTGTPQIDFKPIGDVDVDEKGTWSAVVGAVAGVFAQSPDQQGKDKADKQGTQAFTNELSQGMSVAIDLCTGYQRFSMGRPPKGELGPPDAGESLNMPVEIQPGGLLVFGPYAAPKGMSIEVESRGPVRVGLACADDVEPTIASFIKEEPEPAPRLLAKSDINGAGKLKVKAQKCKVAVVARSYASSPVTFDWKRPAKEIAQSTGTPTIPCSRKAVSSKGDAPAGRAARRR